jgi:2-iminobutanoate/2-iminopropanoate deaminase
LKKATSKVAPLFSQSAASMSSKVQKVHTDKAPAAVGPYSQATRANGMIFVSGQLPLDPVTMKFNSETDVALQAHQCLTNMKNILEAANSDMNHVMKTTILLNDIGDFAKVNKVYAEFFVQNLPARACYAVDKLPLGALVEIEAVAVEKTVDANSC